MRREWSVGAATQGARGRIAAHERELRRMRGRGGLHCITCVVHWTRAVENPRRTEDLVRIRNADWIGDPYDTQSGTFVFHR